MASAALASTPPTDGGKSRPTYFSSAASALVDNTRQTTSARNSSSLPLSRAPDESATFSRVPARRQARKNALGKIIVSVLSVMELLCAAQDASRFKCRRCWLHTIAVLRPFRNRNHVILRASEGSYDR